MALKLNLDLLQTLVAVAETGELKKAAERVFRSHSAVSMQIQRLEKITGTTIIDRSSRGVTLTDKGQVLLSYGKRLLQLNTAALAALRDDDPSGSIRFGIPADYAQAFITRLLPLLKTKLPNLKPKIMCDRSRNLRKKVKSGSLDIAIVAGEPGIADERFLWSEQMNWVASPGFEIDDKDALPVAVFNADCIVKDFCVEGLKKAERDGIKYHTVFSSPVLDNIADAVYNGLAVSLLPESMTPGAKTRILPRHILSCKAPLTINLIHLPSMEESVVNTVTDSVRLAFTGGREICG